MGCYSFLRFNLKVANYSLLMIGLAMTVYSVFMYVQFHNDLNDTYNPPPPPSHLSPPPAKLSTVDNVTGNKTPPPPPPLPPSQVWGNATDSGKVWDVRFIYGFGAAGTFTTITASTGLVGAQKGNYCLLQCYTYELILMIMGQAALAIALFSDKHLYHIPENVSENESKAAHFLQDHMNVAKWGCLGLLLLETLSVAFACCLGNEGQRGDSDDDEDDFSNNRRQPLIRRGASESHSSYSRISQRPPSDGEPRISPSKNTMRYSTWRERMREKYGLDTNNYSYDPERNDRNEGAANEGKQSCVIC